MTRRQEAKVADRALAQGVQHDQAAQLAGLPAAGTRGDLAVFTGFRSAPPGGNGLCSNMRSGTTNGGRSLPLSVLVRFLGPD